MTNVWCEAGNENEKQEKVKHCDGHVPNITAGLAMYSSYFMLFLDFFVRRFCMKRRSPSPKEKKVE